MQWHLLLEVQTGHMCPDLDLNAQNTPCIFTPLDFIVSIQSLQCWRPLATRKLAGFSGAFRQRRCELNKSGIGRFMNNSRRNDMGYLFKSSIELGGRYWQDDIRPRQYNGYISWATLSEFNFVRYKSTFACVVNS